MPNDGTSSATCYPGTINFSITTSPNLLCERSSILIGGERYILNGGNTKLWSPAVSPATASHTLAAIKLHPTAYQCKRPRRRPGRHNIPRAPNLLDDLDDTMESYDDDELYDVEGVELDVDGLYGDKLDDGGSSYNNDDGQSYDKGSDNNNPNKESDDKEWTDDDNPNKRFEGDIATDNNTSTIHNPITIAILDSTSSGGGVQHYDLHHHIFGIPLPPPTTSRSLHWSTTWT